MSIVLTHGYFISEDAKEQAIMRPYAPLGILCLSAWLEQHDFEHEVFDSTFSSLQAQQDFLLKTTPKVLGIYTNLMTKLNVIRIINFVKQEPLLQHTKIILGGPEVRNHAPAFLQQGADFIVLGEGEESFRELCEHILFQKHKVSDIAGIIYRDGNETVIKNAEREKIKNLDILPFPNRKKINLQQYFDAWKSRHGISSASVSTMRGCPYTCKWCSRAVYGLSYRRRSAAQVAEELQHIQKHYDVDSVWFVDDVFTISHKWLETFTDEINKRNITLRYECITRADRMNEEVIKLLKQSGCFRVWIGAESGSQKIIDLMDRRVDVEEVRSMIIMAKKYGIEAGTFIMVGYPGETEEDIKETLHHLKTSDPDYFTITVAYPIKGTPLYEEVEDRFIEQLPWHSSTDRDIDFVRTYPRPYYDQAVKMIVNEVHFSKALKKPFKNWRRLPGLKFRALWARWQMSRIRTKSPVAPAGHPKTAS
jgi:anaerobic magnesium-protoporphyrin IX monomethyl ester cyclase